MFVVEIGCGSDAGPRFEGAEAHYVVDAQPDRVEMAVLLDPTLTPLVADAADLEFADQSVDVVLARNVFGDRTLGTDTCLAKDTSFEGGGIAKRESFADQNKIEIMKEAARILVSGGRLVVVEQWTPKQFLHFLDRAQDSDQWPVGLTPFSETTLEEATPRNYACRRRLGLDLHPALTRTWVATRCPQT